MSKKKNLDLAPSRRERKTVGQYILLFFLIVYTLFCALQFYLYLLQRSQMRKRLHKMVFHFSQRNGQ